MHANLLAKQDEARGRDERDQAPCRGPLPSDPEWLHGVGPDDELEAGRQGERGRDVAGFLEELGGWMFTADPGRWDRQKAREDEAGALLS